MQVVIKNITILSPSSPYHGERTDIFLKDGEIKAIEPNFSEYDTSDTEEWDFEGAYISSGWVDLGTQVGDPGYEHQEDLTSVTKAAIAGGYTSIACQPNTLPVIQSKSEVLYLKNNTRDSLVDFFPIGAISKNCEGKDITEMIDMHQMGAVAFSDGKKSIQDSGLMMRCLQYVKAFDGLVINHPHEKTVAYDGQMHEGTLSTMLGMKGIPRLAEELMLQRDLYLVEYTDSKLHVANISTARSVDLIRAAKRKGLKVTASVSAMTLFFDDSSLEEFETNYKVLPPLREVSDIEALKKGLQDGTIDCITANHVPLDTEAKDLEFPYAEFGTIGLETAFAAARTALKDVLSLEELIKKFSINTRQVLNLPQSKIDLGEFANLTLFQPDRTWTFTKKHIFSKSKNTPFVGMTLKGKVLGVVNGNRYSIVKER